MKVITLKNEDGETVEVKRGKIHNSDVVLVRHSGKDADNFGEFNTVEMLTSGQKAWEFFAKRGIYTNSEAGKEALGKMGFAGLLVINGEQLLVGPEDGKLICEAIKQLDE